jgi:arylsulfatase A-like enzyme
VKTVLLAFAAAALWAAPPPNIVMILSDDHGWRDYGFMGHPQARTPNIDRLAADSLLFTRGYVPSSLCRPSLASIMTGLYPQQHLITGNDPPGNARDPQLRASMVSLFKQSKTIVGELSAAGYVSHQSGKWWEGECTCCGFTECMSHGDVARGGRHGDVGLQIGRQTMQPVFDFVDRAGGKPFLLWYAPMMPHQPHNPPERLLRKYAGLPVAQAKYLAMIEWFDETVGQLTAYLDKKGLSENTLIVYVADNGWVQLEGQQSLFATRAKLSPYDAGLRTPIFFRWKGHIQPRRDDKTLVSSIDIAPTLVAAAGRKPPATWPGIDLRDEKKRAARKAVYGANFMHTAADIAKPAANLKYRWVVQGNWKLIVPYAANDAVELFDLAADPGETTNLAAKRPDLVTDLTKALNQWWRP